LKAGHFSPHPYIIFYIPACQKTLQVSGRRPFAFPNAKKSSGSWNETFYIPPCHKSLAPGLFVLASRQKIPAFRTEIPAVDTRTICLLPIEFFLITHARNATSGKSRPEKTDTAGNSRISGARKGKARKSRQVTTDTAGKFGCQ
jgi:hypothetical protein